MSHRLSRVLVGVAAVLTLALPPAAQAAKTDVKVMSRNLYLGADIIPLATTPKEQFEEAAASRFRVVENNDFATRAKALAAEIKKTKPDIVGLQEAAIWRRGPDGVKDGSQTPATDVVYDSTEVLLKALADVGSRYRVIGGRDWFDFEAPTALGYDVRLTQRDVIIGRVGSKVKFGKTFRGGYSEHFDPPTPIGVAQQLRGWVGVDAKLAGKRFRFITTHLEAYSADTADAQMKELLKGVAKSKKKQTILVGDFNSAPGSNANDRGTSRDANAYYSAIDAGFRNPMKKRLTCCQPEDLHQSKPFESWIDHIVVRPKIKAVAQGIVGNTIVNGLWPSDHAGVWATLRLK
jgi:endonuclease/exonuclease/phosphatase family metal-dependent hydrolase